VECRRLVEAGLSATFRQKHFLVAAPPVADYEVTQARGYEPSKPNRTKGDALQRLKVDVDDCPGSVVVESRKLAR
jgi:hypothetical protein